MHQPNVNLWLLNYHPKLVSYDLALKRLAAAQRQRASTFHSNKRKLEFSLGRLLLEHAVRHEPRYAGNSFEIIERRGLAPGVSKSAIESEELCTTISHSGNWLAVVCWRKEDDMLLGLDIESQRLDWNRAKASYFCNDQQLNFSAGLAKDEQQHFLTRLWTQKEAFFKAHQIPVLNANTKSTDFTGDTLMHSANLNYDYLLSLYCSQPIQICTHFITLGSTTSLIEMEHSEDVSHSLNWS